MIAVIEYYMIRIIKLLKIWLICKGIFGLKPEKKRWKYIFSGIIILGVVLIEVVFAKQKITILNLLAGLIVLVMIFDEKVLQSVKADVVAYFLVEAVESLIYTVIIYVGGFHMDEIIGFSHKLSDILCSLPGLGGWVLAAWICTRKESYFNLESRQYPIMLVSVIVATLQISMVTYFVAGGGYEDTHTVQSMILLLMFISSICVIYVFMYLTKLLSADNVQRQAIQAYKKQQEISQKYYMDLYEKQELDREKQHDLKHFLTYLRTRIKNGDYADAEAMLDEMTQTVYCSESPLIYSRNKVVDAVIYGVLGDAVKHEKIHFSYQGILPQSLHIADMDLCTVLSNALSNALEAALQCNKTGDISMQASCKGSLVLFQIENTMSEENTQIHAEKTGKGEGHGYGIRSMQRIVNRYHGELSYETEPYKCRLNIIFCMGL